jgi:fucose permease
METLLSTQQAKSFTGHDLLLMVIAFLGIFVYGLLAALPGSVLPTLERNQYLPNDSAVATFLLINAVGAVLAYAVSGPIIDRIGKKFALLFGTAMVVASMAGFFLTVTRVHAASALLLISACSLMLGLGANAIVAAGHALVADVASSWRNAALNLLDICFGLGLASLPLVVQRLQQRGGLGLIFSSLGGAAVILLLLILASRFPRPTHQGSSPIREAPALFRNPSFLLLAIGLFMYVGAEVSVGKWVVTFMERDPHILASQGLSSAELQTLAHSSPDLLSRFFESDPLGYAVAGYALSTLTLFAIALLGGRLVSSFLLGIVKVNSFLLTTAGSALTTVSLIVAFTANTALTVRLGLIVAGFGMGPIFPTSVGLASVMMPRIAGTAMSLAMGIGFAGLLLIPPAVGYVSSAVGGSAGDVRTGLMAVVAASVVMLLLHVLLTLRERRRSFVREDMLERNATAQPN